MKISKKIQTEEKIEIEIETPAWYKLKQWQGVDFYQINSEGDILEVKTHDKYCMVTRSPLGYVYESHKIFEGEPITEAEFNAVLSEAILKISGVEVAKEVAA